MPHVVVVGSCNIDLIAYTPRMPGPGETVLGDRFATGFGGKGANQAVMAARLGASVGMVGALGDDAYASMTLANFAEAGVDTTHVARAPGSSLRSGSKPMGRTGSASLPARTSSSIQRRSPAP